MDNQYPLVDNQNDLFIHFTCHDLQWMVTMDTFSSSVCYTLLSPLNHYHACVPCFYFVTCGKGKTLKLPHDHGKTSIVDERTLIKQCFMS